MSEEEKKEELQEEREEILSVQDLVKFVSILSDRLEWRSLNQTTSWEILEKEIFDNTIYPFIEASKEKRKKVNSGNNKFVLEHVLDEWIVRNCVNHIQDEDEKEKAKQTIRKVFCTLMMMDKEKVADFLREGNKFSLLF